MDIGDNLKAARKAVNLSSEEAAKKLGIAYPTLNKYENNHVTPQTGLVLKMCKLYQCDPNKLLGHKNTEPANEAFRGVPVVGKIIDRGNFICDFDKPSTERLPFSIPEPDVYALRVVSNAMSPVVFAGEHLIFKRTTQKEALEITQDDQILRGSPIGQILGAYRKKK